MTDNTDTSVKLQNRSFGGPHFCHSHWDLPCCTAFRKSFCNLDSMDVLVFAIHWQVRHQSK